MKISILDLKAQYQNIKNEIELAMKKVIDNQSFILGEDVAELEKEIADYCNTKYAVGLASGTDALIMALKAFDIGEGDEVITSPFTFFATAESISLVGARPIFVDIDPKTYNINPELIEKKITKNTRAIIPVHLYGQCADMDSIIEIAKSHGLKVIEDTAQALGALYKGRKAASMGDIGTISFFPSKNLGAFGDAGMIVTNDKETSEKIKMLRVHGSSIRYIHSDIGTNSRLDTLQAAVIRVKLRYLDKWLKAKREKAQYYDDNLKGLPVRTPFVPEYNIHTYHLYVIKVEDNAEGLRDYLNANGVESRTYYPVPLHLQECYKNLGYKEGDFKEAERAAKTTLALPIYAEITKEQMDYVIEKIREFYSKRTTKYERRTTIKCAE